MVENAELQPRVAVAWFCHAAPKWPKPSEKQVEIFTREINRLKRLKNKRRGPLEVQREERAKNRLNSVRRALHDLLRDLPQVASDYFQYDESVAQLIMAAREARALFGAPPSAGRPEKPWAAGARLVAYFAIDVWAAAGKSGVSHQTDGPLAQVVAKALEFIEGQAPEYSTIAKQLQRTPPHGRQPAA